MGRDLTVRVDGGWGRQAGERRAGKKREWRLDRTTWHFQQFGLHAKVNKEPLNGFKRE